MPHPEYKIEVSDSKTGMRGFLVIDSTKLGPGKGGLRMTPTVTMDEVARLARAMTYKNSVAGLPFGGAKSGIVWPGGSLALKKKYIQTFAKMISPFIPTKYISAPDVNTAEREMKWFAEALKNRKSATGKPKSLGGLPHELGSTGFGVAHSAAVAARFSGFDLKKTKVAIEGFGNVGTFTFKFLEAWGAKIVAVSDSRGGVFNERGINYKKTFAVKKRTGSVSSQPGKKLKPGEILTLPVDILITATVTDVIDDRNKSKVRAKIIVEGSNIPMKEKVERELHKRGILIVPDFVANAGGVISSYAEYRGWGEKKMFKLVEEKVKASTEAVIKKSLATGKWPRAIALALAQKRLK